jgi:hypothetical protein
MRMFSSIGGFRGTVVSGRGTATIAAPHLWHAPCPPCGGTAPGVPQLSQGRTRVVEEKGPMRASLLNRGHGTDRACPDGARPGTPG